MFCQHFLKFGDPSFRGVLEPNLLIEGVLNHPQTRILAVHTTFEVVVFEVELERNPGAEVRIEVQLLNHIGSVIAIVLVVDGLEFFNLVIDGKVADEVAARKPLNLF